MLFGIDLAERQRPRLHAVPGRARGRAGHRSRVSGRDAGGVEPSRSQADGHLPDPSRRPARSCSIPPIPATSSTGTTDARFQIRAAQVTTPDGGNEIRIRDDAKSPWRDLAERGHRTRSSTSSASRPTAAPRTSVSSLGRDTAALVERNIATGAEKGHRGIGGGRRRRSSSITDEAYRRGGPFAPGRTSWTVVDPALRGGLRRPSRS